MTVANRRGSKTPPRRTASFRWRFNRAESPSGAGRAGSPFLWFARTPSPALFGPLVGGLAIAALFPLANSFGLRHGPTHAIAAAPAWVSPARSPSSAALPLGALADRVGPFSALSSVSVLLTVVGIALHVHRGRITMARAIATEATAMATP